LYNGAVDGVPIYPYIGPCGLAAYQKTQVISEDIETDNRWSANFRALTRDLGLKACWSIPVCDSRGAVIATVALFSIYLGKPSAEHQQLMEISARLTGTAIERHLRDERLRLCAEIVGKSAEAIRILDPSGKIVEQNAAHRELFGIPDEQLLGKTAAAIFGEDQFEGIAERIAAGKQFRSELTAEIDGERRIIDVTVCPVLGESGEIACYAALNRDVTESRRTQEELQKSHAELEARVQVRTAQLQRLFARLMTAQDEERRRIARDLHDSAGQYLAAMLMNLTVLSKSSVIAELEKSRIMDCLEMAERCTTEIRTISYLLHPPLLDEMGLRSAVVSYVEGFAQRSGIRVDLDISTGPKRLGADIETAVFRVIQQSLANVHRHSGSHVAKISLKEEPERVTVTIRDEGGGITAEKLSEYRSGKQLVGVGIAGMRERIRNMQGQFDIRSGADGTTIEISLPISQSAETTGPPKEIPIGRKDQPGLSKAATA
jgi:PAS domain S-box-containing protein